MHRLHALVDGILVRTGEGGKYQGTGIRLSRWNRHLRAALIDFLDAVDILERKLRIHALREHVIGERQDVDIARTLTVSEERTLDTVCTGKQCKLCGRDTLTTIVVRVHGQNHLLTVLEVLRHILDLIGIDIRRIHLHRGRQVDDDLAALTALPCVEHGVTDLGRVIHLGAREGLR